MEYVRDVRERVSRGGQDPPDKKIIEKLVKVDKDYTYRVEFDKGKGADERGSDERGADATSPSTSPESVKLYITLWRTRGELERSEGEARKERDRDRDRDRPRDRDRELRRETDRESKEHVREAEKEEDRDARTEADRPDKETKREAGSLRGERRGRHGLDKEATTAAATITATTTTSRRKRNRDDSRKKNEDMETYCLVGKDDNDLYKAFGRILAECNKDWRKKLERLDEPRPLK